MEGNDRELESQYADTLELVYQEYEQSLDLDIAMTVVPMSQETRARLEVDQDLRARIAVCDAKVRQDLVRKIRGLADGAESEGVKFAAIKELGRTVYPRRFSDAPSPPPLPRQISYVLVDGLK